MESACSSEPRFRQQSTCYVDLQPTVLHWGYYWLLFRTLHCVFLRRIFFIKQINQIKTLFLCSYVLLLIFTGETASNFVSTEHQIDEIFYLLHPSLRPVPPSSASQVSMRVYEEHRMVRLFCL